MSLGGLTCKDCWLSAVLIVLGIVAGAFVKPIVAPVLPFGGILTPIVGLVIIVVANHVDRKVGDVLLGVGVVFAFDIAKLVGVSA